MPTKKMAQIKNRFILLTDLQEKEIFNQLVAVGIIGLNISTWLDIYKTYLVECKENQKPIALQFTADYWKISERNLYRIIRFMEDNFEQS